MLINVKGNDISSLIRQKVVQCLRIQDHIKRYFSAKHCHYGEQKKNPSKLWLAYSAQTRKVSSKISQFAVINNPISGPLLSLHVSTGLWRKLLPIPSLHAQPKHNHNHEKGGGKPAYCAW